MAALSNSLLVALSFSFVLISSSSSVFDRVLDGVDPCQNTCANTYSAHTYENGGESESCKRGCRFYAMMAFIHNHAENDTLRDCVGSCHEAYNKTQTNSSSEGDACVAGCQNQLQAEQAKEEKEEEDNSVHILYPLMYVHSMYSNMLNKMYRHMEVSWFVFMQPDTGKVVVMHSPPRIVNVVPVDVELEDIPDNAPWPDDRTSSGVETNIAKQDNSATPFFSFPFGSSQLKSTHSGAHGLQMDVDDSGKSDWLSCVARKTGIARIVLCFLILATAVFMIWFCLTAAATTPEQHLSINGDLEYLRTLDEKDVYKLLQPQTRLEARPLPVKIKVQQI